MPKVYLFGFSEFNQSHCFQQRLCEISKYLPDESESTGASVNKCITNTSLNECFAIEDNLFFTCQILFSWSYYLFYHNETFWFCGFIDGKSNSVKALKAPQGKTILQASCNRRQVLCVTEDGGCWQYTLESELWKDLTPILKTEIDHDESSEVRASKVCCGDSVTAVLDSKGVVFNLPNKLHLPGVKIVDIACGRAHILLLSDRGEVFSVGEGSRGQLGLGELEAEEEPRLVEGLAGLTVKTIACGGWHSCAVTADGDLYTWGWNMCGQLGLKTSKSDSGVAVQAVPVVVDWPGVEDQDIRVCSVACGARHTVALTEGGDVWACGWNGYGQLSLLDTDSVDQMTRVALPGGIPVSHVICGPWNTCLVT